MVNGPFGAAGGSGQRAAAAARRSPLHLLRRFSVLSGLLVVSVGVCAAEPDPPALLRRADRVKDAWPEVVITLRVTTLKPGASPSTGLFKVQAKGRDSRVTFENPADAGKAVVSRGDDSWLILPKTRNPIRIPRSQRLAGGFSAADMSKTRFADDYDAVLERADVLDGRDCSVLRLMAKKGRTPTYPVARVWIDGKEGLYRKAVFLVASGKTAKETMFDEYRVVRGALSLAKMTIVDELRPGRTVVEYLDYEKASLPDATFEPKPIP
ncbi:MAG: outer membrane lipoprotein-sorting protein [Thermoanaerobaculia bacterium]